MSGPYCLVHVAAYTDRREDAAARPASRVGLGSACTRTPTPRPAATGVPLQVGRHLSEQK